MLVRADQEGVIAGRENRARFRAPERAAVSDAGMPALVWALGTVRHLFGETWLADNAAVSGHVPLVSPERWPLSNQRAVTRLLELAARVAMVERDNGASKILEEGRTIHPDAEATSKQFKHLMLVLECAAFAIAKGWSISYEVRPFA
jgi:hypothetical protein